MNTFVDASQMTKREKCYVSLSLRTPLQHRNTINTNTKLNIKNLV